jgi:hypothetical protein
MNGEVKMKPKPKPNLEVICIGADEPFAFITVGHNNFKDHLKAVNEDWLDPIADKENTFHQYIFNKGDIYLCDVNPKRKGALKATITYWEEPYPNKWNKRKCEG